MLCGRWGLIPVFPWTTKKEIERRARSIHSDIGKVHADVTKTRRLTQIAGWLRLHMNPGEKLPPRSEIAAAVWGLEKGLHRPTKETAIDRLPEKEEQRLLRQYMAKGLPRGEAGRKVYRHARGSEAPAAAMVRMAERREQKAQHVLFTQLQSPLRADPLAAALMDLLRLIQDKPEASDEIQRKAGDIRALCATFHPLSS
jgi:hypothetical protein